ncbi:MAG: methyltransferase domain-containing protein [Planctomycetales bacterium]|nr:methyltransferase domain-containing protein [Planctomycetales bacterium]
MTPLFGESLRGVFRLAHFPWLTERICELEVMDDPELDRQRHFTALRGLTRLNGLSASTNIVWSPIARLAQQQNINRLRVLDVATGAGDLPLRLWRKARRANLQLEIHGIDISPQALDFARQNAEAQGANIKFGQLDVLNGELPRGFDVVISSLFFHHLSNPQAAELLRGMAAAANRLVLVSDLRRSLSGWLLAHAASRLFTRSDVVHTDAPLSVQAALTLCEMRALAAKVGLEGANVNRRWPCRFLLEWSRPRH